MRCDDLHLILEHLLFNDRSILGFSFAGLQGLFIGVVAEVTVALVLVDTSVAVLRIVMGGFYLFVGAYGFLAVVDFLVFGCTVFLFAALLFYWGVFRQFFVTGQFDQLLLQGFQVVVLLEYIGVLVCEFLGFELWLEGLVKIHYFFYLWLVGMLLRTVFIHSRSVVWHSLFSLYNILFVLLFDFFSPPHFYLAVLASILIRRRRQEHQLSTINHKIGHLLLLCLLDLPKILLNKLLKLNIQAFPLCLVKLYQVLLIDRSPILPLRIFRAILMLHNRQKFRLWVQVSLQLHGLPLIRHHSQVIQKDISLNFQLDQLLHHSFYVSIEIKQQLPSVFLAALALRLHSLHILIQPKWKVLIMEVQIALLFDASLVVPQGSCSFVDSWRFPTLRGFSESRRGTYFHWVCPIRRGSSYGGGGSLQPLLFYYGHCLYYSDDRIAITCKEKMIKKDRLRAERDKYEEIWKETQGYDTFNSKKNRKPLFQ